MKIGHFSIKDYATASTSDSVFVIGGLANGYRTTVIAQFKDDDWFHAGNLKGSRYGHNALTFETMTMIVGSAGAR